MQSRLASTWIRLLMSIPALSFANFLGACAKNQTTADSGAGANQRASQVEERYRYFEPAGLKGEVPLLVMIHGCDQTAEIFEKGTEMNAYAEKFGFAVLYPDQKKGRNRANCWRWFDPENRQTERGELAEIKKMIDRRARGPVYVAGLSSGAATAAALLACYPEAIQGAAIHSGPALDSADNEFAALAAMKFGPSPWLDFWTTKSCPSKQRPKRLLVIQGERDGVVNPRHAEKLIEQFSGGVDQESSKNRYRLAIESIGRRPIEITGWLGVSSQSYLIRVGGMKHAWAGGRDGKYFDSAAFSASEVISRYLVRGEQIFRRADSREIPTYSSHLER